MKRLEISENQINLVLQVCNNRDVVLLHFSALPFEQTLLAEDTGAYRLMELQTTGESREEHHGLRYLSTYPGLRMKYLYHEDIRNSFGRLLRIQTSDEVTGLQATYQFQFYDGIPVVRCTTELHNLGQQNVGVEYLSSFSLLGISKEGLLPDEEKLRLFIPHQGWQGELQWQKYRLSDLGFHHLADTGLSSKRIQVTNVGSWSGAEYLPMAYVENSETNSGLFWQIEHNGSWHWEICDKCHQLSLLVSGPSETEHHWWRELRPGETFTSVPVAVGSVTGGFDNAMEQLTRYRRAIRRKNKDNEKLPVIFNDYMNCLWAKPTTEKLLPLIDAAAAVGCEYFCIDAGWHADGEWWDEVGEWKPSKWRFPNGLKEVTDHIRKNGMVPGMWLEIEVMGIKSPKLKDTDDTWFFMRHGKRVIDRSRYQLDFRNPAVQEFATSVITRLMKEYGVGYIKMDYNINAGIGTETNADSFGDGLLQHNRAYLSWLDSMFAAYPDLVIENCSSGGMRMDYAMLSRHSIQSTSDQPDYMKYAVIAVNSPTAVTPEQAAIWSYPMTKSDREEIIFNMVNAMLFRIHQSGHMGLLETDSRDLVAEGIRCYKNMRGDIASALPFWPLGLAQSNSEWVSVGLKIPHRAYVAVWRINSTKDCCMMPISHLKGIAVKVRCIYPSENENCGFRWNEDSGTLSVCFRQNKMARMFELDY